MIGFMVASFILIAPPEAPYVSCQDGHIAASLAECPHVAHPQDPYGGNAPRGGGGKKGLLGLGGLGGIL